MKILHYVSTFSQPSETFIYDLVLNLEKTFDNYVLTHNRVLEKERSFKKLFLINENVSFFKKVYFKLCRKKWMIRNEQEVLKILLELKPDIIHAHFGPNGIKMFNLLEEYKIDKKLIVSFHGMDINVLPKDRVYLKNLLKLSKATNTLFTSPSSFLKQKMIHLGMDEKKIFIIPNAYNEIFKNVKKEKYWKKGDKLKLLHIGRFTEVKGQIYLIKAMRKIVDYYPKTILTLIGYGELEEDLKRLSRTLNLENNIKFLGKVKHKELPSIFVEYDIYIQPSIVAKDGAEESLGVSTIEAQVSELPTIVSNIGGLKEIVIDNKTGFLVEEKSENNIFEKVKFYIENEKMIKNHSKFAKKEAMNRFDKNKILELIREVYEI